MPGASWGKRVLGFSMLRGSCLKPAFEVLAEARDIAVADAFGDASDGEFGGAQEFGGFFEAESLEIALKAEAMLLAEEPREIAGAGEGDFAGNFGELQRAMQSEGEMRGGALERIAFGFSV